MQHSAEFQSLVEEVCSEKGRRHSDPAHNEGSWVRHASVKSGKLKTSCCHVSRSPSAAQTAASLTMSWDHWGQMAGSSGLLAGFSPGWSIFLAFLPQSSGVWVFPYQISQKKNISFPYIKCSNNVFIVSGNNTSRTNVVKSKCNIQIFRVVNFCWQFRFHQYPAVSFSFVSQVRLLFLPQPLPVPGEMGCDACVIHNRVELGFRNLPHHLGIHFP